LGAGITSAAETPLIDARRLAKTFASRRVLADVDLQVTAGEVHGLLGQNGSGKSTLIKILSGYHAPDPGGSLTIAGRPVSLPLRPGEALQHGLGFVHQDLGLSMPMTVLENLRVGRYETKAFGRVPWASERRRVKATLAEFDVDISPDTKVEDLREVERAIVAILRALDQLSDVSEGVLVLDEPTAYLPRDGVEHLLASVRRVTARGFGVLFVTHRLDEVFAATDRVTVLRNGAHVATVATNSLDESELIELIIGRALDELYPAAHHAAGEVALVVEGLTGPSLPEPFSLTAREGEIVGLTGLVGMGYERPLYLIAGADEAEAGSVAVGSRTAPARRLTPGDALGLGIALLPANRLRYGAAGEATVRENVTLPTLSRYFRGGRLRRREESSESAELIERFAVVPPKPEISFAKLSGGNQQKALLGKWFATGPTVLLLHEPSQGVDVGARQQLFGRIRELADAGTSVVMASAEYGELAQVCDRVLVFRDGRVVSELRGDDLTEDRIAQRSLLEQPVPAGPTASGEHG
jgi:ribose transport system ATP-binding protein